MLPVRRRNRRRRRDDGLALSILAFKRCGRGDICDSRCDIFDMVANLRRITVVQNPALGTEHVQVYAARRVQAFQHVG